jgi:hypothetical protein
MSMWVPENVIRDADPVPTLTALTATDKTRRPATTRPGSRRPMLIGTELCGAQIAVVPMSIGHFRSHALSDCIHERVPTRSLDERNDRATYEKVA